MARVTMDKRFVSERFPRSSAYHPDWIAGCVSNGANSLRLVEWLTEKLDLKPGMRLLDLGCGRAASSIFLHREFGAQVWATDLWFDPAENLERIRDAGMENNILPVHADARSLPFEKEFFDAVVSIDSFVYYGTDDRYLNYLARFVKPHGAIGIAGVGLMQELEGTVPDHLREWWEPGMWCLHSAPWWKRHWEQTGIVNVEVADHMPEGWKEWLQWQRAICPDNLTEIQAVETDAGRYLGYVRVIGRRREDAKLEEPIVSMPYEYRKAPLLRE
jgi:cyclopropane fatty-acyl-phospholipid synthase-like methyltransferase